jgi:outer membrane protein insertion porin family
MSCQAGRKGNTIKKLVVYTVFILGLHSDLLSQEIHIESLDFQGNETFSGGKLKAAIQTDLPSWYETLMFWKKPPRFDQETFLNDLLRIEKFYHTQGYLEAKISDYELKYNAKRDRVKATIMMDEGKPTIVSKVAFQYPNQSEPAIPEERLRRILRLKKGKRYREEDLRLDYHKIIDEFSNRGHPFVEARVKPTSDRQTHLIALEWRLEPGPYSHFGEIQISGNRSVSDAVILRGLGFRTGQPFVQSKLANAQSQVYRLELFRFVSLKAMDLDQEVDNIPIEIRVRETNLRTLKLGVGYGTEELFRTTAEWRHRNFLGGGRIFRTQARHSTELLPLQVEVEVSQPYFLDNRNDLIVKPFFVWQDERSFEARRVGFETTFNRQLTRRTNAFITSRVERDTVDIKLEGSAVTEALADLYNKSLLRIGINRNSTNELFNPSRGSVSRLVVEEAGRFLRTRFKYLKASAEYRKYLQIRPGHIFAWRTMIGTMGPIRGSIATPVEERFFLGGSYSVRGWRRQLLGPLEISIPNDSTRNVVPIGGNSVIEGSFEFRNPIYKSLSAAVFLDYGNVWKEWNGFDLSALHYSIGAGIRYNTLIGPIRADFAWKLNKQPLDSGIFEFHISIGQSF